MIAFYLLLAVVGAVGAALIREVAVAQAKQRSALRPVRVRAAPPVRDANDYSRRG